MFVLNSQMRNTLTVKYKAAILFCAIVFCALIWYDLMMIFGRETGIDTQIKLSIPLAVFLFCYICYYKIYINFNKTINLTDITKNITYLSRRYFATSAQVYVS